MINFRGRQTKHAIQHQAKKTAQQMEEETKQMEARLQELKLAMENEKEKRTMSGNPGHWSRGQAGALTNYKSVSAGAKKPAIAAGPAASGIRKVRLMRDEPVSMPDRSAAGALPGTLAHLAKLEEAQLERRQPLPSRTQPTMSQQQGSSSSSSGSPKCGQCEERAAAVLCPECAEQYCAKCFAAFHLKGALRKHRSLPLSVTTPRQSLGGFNDNSKQLRQGSSSSSRLRNAAAEAAASAAAAAAAAASARHKASTGTDSTSLSEHSAVFQDPSHGVRRSMVRQLLNEEPSSGSSLLEGTVNERENAQDFQRAVAEWRRAAGGANGGVGRRVDSHSTGTDAPSTGAAAGATAAAAAMAQIKFTSSLTFAEQLLLQKHRRSDVGSMPVYAGKEDGSNGKQNGDNSNQTSGSVQFNELRDLHLALTPRQPEATQQRPGLQKMLSRTTVDEMFADSPRNSELKQQTILERKSVMAKEAKKEEMNEEAEAHQQPPASARSQTKQRKQRGIEWQRRSSRPNSARRGEGVGGGLGASVSPGLAAVAALHSRRLQQLDDEELRRSFDSTQAGPGTVGLDAFLLLGVSQPPAGPAASRSGRAWSGSGSARSRVSADIGAGQSRPGSGRVSNKVYALSTRSWRPQLAANADSVDEVAAACTAAQADRLMSLPAEDSHQQLHLEEVVDIEAEARVLEAMPLSRPVSARHLRSRTSAVHADVLAAAAAIAEAAADPAAAAELDVTADYLQDDVEHLARLTIELAEADHDHTEEPLEQADASQLQEFNREFTQEQEEESLLQNDESDMERLDTSRYNDREDVRQLS